MVSISQQPELFENLFISGSFFKLLGATHNGSITDCNWYEFN